MDLSGFIKASDPQSLPKDVQFTDEASDTLHTARSAAAAANLGLGKLYNVFNSWESFEDFRELFTSFVGDPPPAADHWHTDV